MTFNALFIYWSVIWRHRARRTCSSKCNNFDSESISNCRRSFSDALQSPISPIFFIVLKVSALHRIKSYHSSEILSSVSSSLDASFFSDIAVTSTTPRVSHDYLKNPDPNPTLKWNIKNHGSKLLSNFGLQSTSTSSTVQKNSNLISHKNLKISRETNSSCLNLLSYNTEIQMQRVGWGASYLNRVIYVTLHSRSPFSRKTRV